MDQDVEVALRITEAIVAKRSSVAERGDDLARTYVNLFTAVHVKVKEYLAPPPHTEGREVAPVVRH